MSESKQYVDVDLEYPEGVDGGTPYIRCAVVPRVGELIQLTSGHHFRVQDVIHTDGHIIAKDGETKVSLHLVPFELGLNLTRDDLELVEWVCDSLDGWGGLEENLEKFERLHRKIACALDG